MTAASEDMVRRKSRRIAWATVFLVVILIVAIAASFASAALRPVSDREEWFALITVFWLPSIFYVAALVALAASFFSIGKGALFASTVARGLRQSGWAIMLGGVASLLVTPMLQTAVLPRGFADGTTQPFRGLLFDTAHLVMVLLGLALVLVSSLIAIAAEAHSRKEALETELSEFL